MPSNPLTVEEVWQAMIADIGGTPPTDSTLLRLMLAFGTACTSIGTGTFLPLSGGTMGGSINMGTNSVLNAQNVNVIPTVLNPVAGALSLVPANIGIYTTTVVATTAITMSGAAAVDGLTCVVRVYDNGSPQTLSWSNTENSSVSAPLSSNGSTTSPRTVTFQYNNATTKWRCIGNV